MTNVRFMCVACTRAGSLGCACQILRTVEVEKRRFLPPKPPKTTKNRTRDRNEKSMLDQNANQKNSRARHCPGGPRGLVPAKELPTPHRRARNAHFPAPKGQNDIIRISNSPRGLCETSILAKIQTTRAHCWPSLCTTTGLLVPPIMKPPGARASLSLRTARKNITFFDCFSLILS